MYLNIQVVSHQLLEAQLCWWKPISHLKHSQVSHEYVQLFRTGKTFLPKEPVPAVGAGSKDKWGISTQAVLWWGRYFPGESVCVQWGWTQGANSPALQPASALWSHRKEIALQGRAGSSSRLCCSAGLWGHCTAHSGVPKRIQHPGSPGKDPPGKVSPPMLGQVFPTGRWTERISRSTEARDAFVPVAQSHCSGFGVKGERNTKRNFLGLNSLIRPFPTSIPSLQPDATLGPFPQITEIHVSFPSQSLLHCTAPEVE